MRPFSSFLALQVLLQFFFITNLYLDSYHEIKLELRLELYYFVEYTKATREGNLLSTKKA